jgi:hypothetical protein
VDSGAFGTTRTPCTTVGQTEEWVRLAEDERMQSPPPMPFNPQDEIAFIEKTMAFWKGGSFTIRDVTFSSFACNQRLSADQLTTPDYLECFGAPCGGPKNVLCGSPAEYCSRSGLDIQSSPSRRGECTVCEAGGCTCIFGECLRRPLPSDAGAP